MHPAAMPATHQRPVRSFVKRLGRITDGQRRALQRLLPHFGLDPAAPLNTAAVFNRSAPVIVEIGFGDGASLAAMARARPEWNYVGIEVHEPGIGHLLLQIEQQGIDNIRIYCHDAVEVLRQCISDTSLAGVLLFFPDPWPKKRHYKRRIVTPEFATLVAQKLAPGAFWHLATDWTDYARQMVEVLDACPTLINQPAAHDFTATLGDRPETKFERRGRRLGHQVYDLTYRKVSMAERLPQAASEPLQGIS